MAYDPALNDHKAWLGYLQPEGLVVSAAALVDAQVVLDRNATELQQRFLEFVEEVDTGEDTTPAIADFARFACEFLGWPEECLLGLDGARPLPERLIVPLPDLSEILRPSLAFVDDRHEGGAPLLLAQVLKPHVELDTVTTGDQAGWSASAGQRFERLLRETGVPIGVMCNGTHLRLVYAPRGESSGSLTWPIRHLTEVAGRPLVGALHLLLSGCRLLTGPTSARLPALLSRSRDYQSQVSTALAGQVLEALYELLRGFQAADAGANGELLREPLERDPNALYAGLLAVLMRLVFLLYAEDKGLLPATALYVRNYGVHGLFERLRTDRERYADTMDQRYGGWAQLIALFGAVHAGCRHPEMAMPARQGHLFDPERYPFLEGRMANGEWRMENDQDAPHQPPEESDDADRVLPRPGGVAAGAGSGAAGVRPDPDLPAGGAVRPDFTDAPSGGVHPVEPGRGLGAEVPGGVHPVHPQRGGQPGRTGDPARAEPGPRPDQLRASGTSAGGAGHPGSPAPEPGAQRHEASEGRGLRAAADHSPLTTHHSLPRLSDGCLERVLRNLLILNGERLSYRTLDVEEIGSVYQTIMGFALERVAGTSIAIVGKRKHKSEVAAPVVINLDALLAQPGKDRAKWLKDATGHDWTGKTYSGLKDARSVDDVLTILDRRIARQATPHPVYTGGPVLQPTDERRRTGSHYTPRKLTEPIVRKTLEPVLAQLGEHPTPGQILDLKLCDPAMGSGAFLVEACRQLAEALVAAWQHHGLTPDIPLDEDELMVAKRLVAQRCLYGVDKNPMAVDLAKLSLWLATLAKDHPFTFVDHSLRAGDSLVGLTRAQIAGFTWGEPGTLVFGQEEIGRRLDQAAAERRAILEGGDRLTPAAKADKLRRADDQLDRVRFVGDLVVAAFFAADKPKAREERRQAYLDGLLRVFHEAVDRPGAARALVELSQATGELRAGEHPVTPFHWAIELPEVFGGRSAGFDAIVGNPPFLGGARISQQLGPAYFTWLRASHPPAGHQCDLVGYFFRRAYDQIRIGGAMGLLATNTIAQGDTRNGGLSVILQNQGAVIDAVKRYAWPGDAAVIVSRICIGKGIGSVAAWLDGRAVRRVSAYLLEGDVDTSPLPLCDHPYFSTGSKIYGQGFLFDDTDPKATPLEEMATIVAAQTTSRDRIRPYIGGDELNADALVEPSRFAIYFSDIATEAELGAWPALEDVVRRRVRPERLRLPDSSNNRPLKKRWWAYQAHRPELYDALACMDRTLVCCQTSKYLAFSFCPASWTFSQKVVIVASQSMAAFALVQSRPHEGWAQALGSTMKDDPVYTPSDCYETFPFPPNWESNPALESIGQTYYDFRADLMVRHDEGLTKTYNRFHDPGERNADILRLRELHAEMDRAVLEAYGWNDLVNGGTAVNGEWRMVSGGEPPCADHSPFTTPHLPPCGFGLDYLDTDDDELSDEAAALLPEGEMWWPTAAEAVAFAAAVGGKKRLPWRYRWPGEVRDEVLARLLALNAERAAAERLAGLAAGGHQGSTAKPGGRGPRQSAGGLFDDEE